MDGVKEIVIVSFSTVKATTVEGAEKDILQVVIIVIPAEAAQEALQDQGVSGHTAALSAALQQGSPCHARHAD